MMVEAWFIKLQPVGSVKAVLVPKASYPWPIAQVGLVVHIIHGNSGVIVEP